MNQNYIGTLYIVPTPIGNLQDISIRAIDILKTVDLIAAEDTRHTYYLLKYFNINTTMTSLHTYNEEEKTKILINILKKKNIALVSNAGTPTINDPGYHLIKTCHKNNIIIKPLPGPCAAITALSASGLPSNQFCYEGFIPREKSIRINFLKYLQEEKRTIIFYESCHRILNSIQDIVMIFGKNRKIVLAKEITKKWENIQYGKSIDILSWLQQDILRQKGEMVIIISGFKKNTTHQFSRIILNTLSILMNELSIKTSVHLTSKIHKINKNILYKYAIKNFKNDKK